MVCKKKDLTLLNKLNLDTNFVFIKRGDGELACMNYEIGANCDGHLYSKPLGDKLKESYNILKDNAIIVEWDDQKSYNTLLHRTDNEGVDTFFKKVINSNKPKVLIAPEKLKYVAILFNAEHIVVPELNVFDSYNEIINQIPIVNNGIYLFCSGMPAKLMIADLFQKNPNAIYLDCGSSFDPAVGITRTLQINKDEFWRLYLPTISFIIPQLGREEGLKKCIDSIESLDYPKELIDIYVVEGSDSVPIKVQKGVEQTHGEYLVYAANDMIFYPDCIFNAIMDSMKMKKNLISFNEGQLLPDNGNICTHFLIKRDLVNRIGGIFDVEFNHVGCDNLLWYKCTKLNESYYSINSRIEHNHFSKTGQYDEVYEKGWKNANEDRLTLKNKIKWKTN